MLSRQWIVWNGSRFASRREVGFVRAGHPERVREIALALGRELRLGRAELRALGEAARLHDLGRALLPPYADEKLHPRVGADLLLGQDLPLGTREAVLHHHERWDGRGYPHGLRGSAIPRLARILAVANAADHLGRLPAEILAERLAWERGLALDAEIVNAYLRMVGL
ncbi:hypothetical protein GCM10022631_31040 [Deinococcus rubellus]|uniref:HD domain-containing protein n=1 Tax=Deinococcus rubellus TaxID=1889240 RepID=A0ABY5YH72_9DEIO|nr:HD domain-containing phosphohydrolase [Deinococcus rubellus]UWX63447.1 HD domain-containing protein [Deinococcus rubellus]